jgi:hypothetical protein
MATLPETDPVGYSLAKACEQTEDRLGRSAGRVATNPIGA